MNPRWEKLTESESAKRLKQLLPSSVDGDFFDACEQGAGLEFPILQPLTVTNDDFPLVEDWTDSPAAIVFEIRFQDTLSLLPGSEYTLGEVSIPFAKLAKKGEIKGWYRVLGIGTTKSISGASDPESKSEYADDPDCPEIFVQLSWKAPRKVGVGAGETDKEASFAIQEELIRSALATKERKVGLVDTSIGTLSGTFRGISDNLLLVQNTLGSILDFVGALKSAFNFSVSQILYPL